MHPLIAFAFEILKSLFGLLFGTGLQPVHTKDINGLIKPRTPFSARLSLGSGARKMVYKVVHLRPSRVLQCLDEN